MLWSNVWKWRVKEEIRWELKGGCDIKPVNKGFVTVSGCVLISDSVVCDQGEKGDKNSILYFEVEVYNIVNRKKKMRREATNETVLLL